MGIIKRGEIIGYYVRGEIVCDECINKEELDSLVEENIMTESACDDAMIFCDRCKKQL